MKVGIIGSSIEGLPAECLRASGDDARWQVIYLNRESSASFSNPLIRKVITLIEFCLSVLRIACVDVVLVVYVNRSSHWYLRIAHSLKRKCVLYWLGSDVQQLIKGAFPSDPLLKADAQIAYSEGNIAELKTCGINADLVVLPTTLSDRVALMPDCHAVLLSLPDNRKEFYGYHDLMKLVDDFPDVMFHVVRSEHPEYYDRPNIIFEGMLDREEMDAVFDRVSISIRWPEHDGTSLVLMESALKGKYIITRNAFPCGTEVHSYKELHDTLRDLLALPVDVCMENREYALAHFMQEQAGRVLAEKLDAVIESRRVDTKVS